MKKAKNELQKITQALSYGKFADTDWSNVWRMLDYLRSISTDFAVNVFDGGYSPNGQSKTYNFDMVYTGKKISGYLTAFACGTVENPWSEYDVAICLD